MAHEKRQPSQAASKGNDIVRKRTSAAGTHPAHAGGVGWRSVPALQRGDVMRPSRAAHRLLFYAGQVKSATAAG